MPSNLREMAGTSAKTSHKEVPPTAVAMCLPIKVLNPLTSTRNLSGNRTRSRSVETAGDRPVSLGEEEVQSHCL